MTTKTLDLDISGMTCAACVGRVERGLSKLDGVQEASVNLATERASVTYDPALIGPAALVQRVRDVGYDAPSAEITFPVAGMTCAACVGRVERALGKVEGVLAASVNLATEQASVQYLPASTAPQALKAAVKAAGYDVPEKPSGAAQARSAPDAERERKARELTALRRSLMFSSVFSVPLLLIAMLPMLWPPLEEALMGALGVTGLHALMLALATPVQFGPGRRFYRSGWAALRHRSPDMNTLVMLGTTAAYVYSLLVTLAPGLFPAGSAQVYFEASGVVISLILLGKYFEALAKGRSSEAMRGLLALRPPLAHVIRNGAEQDIDVNDVQLGDVLRVRPGERVPVDGEITQGRSYVDESMLTGESMPVQKTPGEALTGGTLNGNGALTFTATAVGADTALSRITALVEQAQASKPPIQGLADRVVAVFVPVVLVIAAVTFAAWLLLGGPGALAQALVHTVAVLIVACPCAMGLATPVSVMVGSGKAAQLGVLFRSGAALEGLGRVRVMALDKTGTVTSGQPEVTEIVADDESRLLSLAAAAEQHSEHPLGRAIVRAAQERGLSIPAVQDVQAVTGYGLKASWEGQRLEVGSERYMAGLGLAVGAAGQRAAQLADRGRTPVFVALGGQLLGLLAVADPLRSSSARAVQAMRAQGAEVAMITGDLEATARAVAAEVGITEVRAGVLPAGKAEAVQDLQRLGPVAFVGDGVNDAPALARANVGIAIGSGTDVAAQTADVLLLSSDLSGVPNAVALSRATLSNIRLNLFWAFAYNVLLIPVAAGALSRWNLNLSPVLAAAAMGLSSVFVLSNALRLRGFRAPLAAPVPGARQNAAAQPAA
ncbi:heavy metal translocating P-type ATPase [Deinococcus irradiatisoli]|uniref:P-type Cu(+) transporter n=1 Tax=Deinococcus irradiatisoli TaxID=2202254 RepID=A0A2Z3J9S8_9DEIO|nr:heavy metal translocating P-type ATPase [Deinococcus irradiatisoli]AWN21833.1 heavy metal translocating P-type ATPase [Deinococcus irradiatisoli]